jgi:hypothetical protein
MADPKATPISALPRGTQGQGDEDQQFIQNILQQMNNDNQESEQAYQQTQQNYNNQQFAVNPGEQHAMNQKQIQEAQYEQMEDEDYEQYQYEEEVPLTFMDKLKMEIKGPIVFVILYFVLSIPFIRYFIADQLKRFTKSDNIQLYGSALICGLVGGIIFYFINKFVIKF